MDLLLGLGRVGHRAVLFSVLQHSSLMAHAYSAGVPSPTRGKRVESKFFFFFDCHAIEWKIDLVSLRRPHTLLGV